MSSLSGGPGHHSRPSHPRTRSEFPWSSSRRHSPGSAASRRRPNGPPAPPAASTAPAVAAAPNLLADAVRRGGADHDHIVQALKAAGVHEAFASVFDAASERVTEAADDPFDFDERLHADNLAGAAGDVRRAFTWL
ncbi:hypothetical protein ACFRCI_44610 [Streptomyces sp. NPDC056638]|uniref:hypothetical protein n=1 Tax=Streptomyces sp. NPDC056638 TaxID=3345887 RepID=UPI00367ADA62